MCGTLAGPALIDENLPVIMLARMTSSLNRRLAMWRR
jgi:hypothetical protein